MYEVYSIFGHLPCHGMYSVLSITTYIYMSTTYDGYLPDVLYKYVVTETSGMHFFWTPDSHQCSSKHQLMLIVKLEQLWF